MPIILKRKSKLRNLWWVGLFFMVLAAITFPLILLSRSYDFEITMMLQAAIVLVASLVCQLISREPLENLFGSFNLRWFKFLFVGLIAGAALMLVPALFLFVFGFISWQVNSTSMQAILNATLLFAAVAVAEELLFRGFIFQKLMAAISEWPAQLVIAGLFLLTHLNNPGMTGSVKILAGINIYLASIMFGLAFIRTKTLSMPIGLHFMANWMQGVMLGFGVSGNKEESLLKPLFGDDPAWITGGSFGLEASVPGLISVIAGIFLLYRWKPVPAKQNTPIFKPW